MSNDKMTLTIGGSIVLRFDTTATWRTGSGEITCPAGEARGGVRVERNVDKTADGAVITALDQKARDLYRIRNVGYVFQDFKLLEDMTVQDNLNLLRLEGVDTANMDGLLDRLGILRLKRRRVNRLSGGEKQRVAIARALIKKPAIILADEPTGNLNYETGVEVVRTLIDNAGGGTLIAVTHDDRLAPMFDERFDMNAVAAWVPGGEAREHA